MKATHYRGKKDGDIKKYLIKRHYDGAVSPSFVGFEPFKQLWELGVVIPEITSIRLYFSGGRDEQYFVVDENHLDGVALKVHSGQSGMHNTRDLLTKTEAAYWEVESLHPKAFRE